MFASVGDLNRSFLENDLPEIADQYLRRGRLKLSFEPVNRATLGDPAAERLTRLALATGFQDRLWSFYVTFGSLSDGSLSSAQQQRALELVPSLDVTRARAAARSAKVSALLRRTDAQPAGGGPLPRFFLTADGVPPIPVRADCAGCLLDRLPAALHRLGDQRANAEANVRAKAKAKAQAKAKARAKAKAKARARARAKTPPAPAPASVPTVAPTAPPPSPTSAPPPARTPAPTPKPEKTIFPPD
jgi:hypothetical protein